MTVTREQVMQCLAECYDPEIPINIVDLGLVYHVAVEDDRAHVKMTLTVPGCPMAGTIVSDVRRKLEALPGMKEVNVELVWEPAWDPSRLSPAARQKLGLERAS